MKRPRNRGEWREETEGKRGEGQHTQTHTKKKKRGMGCRYRG